MPDLELSQFVVLAAVIAGVVELITRARAKDFWAAVTIISAALVGGLFGAIDYYPNLDVAQGVAFGFGASGLLTGIGMLGKRSTPTESPDTVVAK